MACVAGKLKSYPFRGLPDGAVVQADKSGDATMYGAGVGRRRILEGKEAIPASGEPLIHELREYEH